MKVTRTDLHRCYSPISFTVIRTVLKEMAGDPELQKWREKYLDIYPQDPVPVSRAAPVAREWREIPRTEPDPETTPDNSYRNYL